MLAWPLSLDSCVATWTVAKCEAIVVARSGVVTVVPQRAMCSGLATVRCTWRVIPLPEYQRLLGSWFWTTMASTLGVWPSAWTRWVTS